LSDPNLATSGRWESWWRLISYFSDQPWYLIFGIGYKTLPHTQLFGRALIADFMFAFWCGEMIQMVTGDLFTYWRNLVVFFAGIALVLQGPAVSVASERSALI
jgi:hypothetical protein